MEFRKDLFADERDDDLHEIENSFVLPSEADSAKIRERRIMMAAEAHTAL